MIAIRCGTSCLDPSQTEQVSASQDDGKNMALRFLHRHVERNVSEAETSRCVSTAQGFPERGSWRALARLKRTVSIIRISLFEKPCLCTQHKTQITIYNPFADEQREYAAEGKIRRERIFHALFFFAGGGDTQYDGRNNGCNERCEKYAFYAERKPARSHKFYVAETHSLFFENEPRDKIEPTEEHDRERKTYKARFPIDVSFIEKAGYSTDNGYKHRHTVGNITVFCIDQRGDDERRGNEHTRNRIHIAEIFRQVREQRPQNGVYYL